MRTYRVNRPTAGKGRSAGSNARVVCSTLLCAMPIYGRGSCLFLCQRTNFMHARHSFICGRGTKRIRESARLLRVMCSHAWYRESYGDRQTCFCFFIYLSHSLATHASCDSVAYAEGVQKRKAFLFLSFSYFSDRRKVHGAFLLLFRQAKSTLFFMYFCMTQSTNNTEHLF